MTFHNCSHHILGLTNSAAVSTSALLATRLCSLLTCQELLLCFTAHAGTCSGPTATSSARQLTHGLICRLKLFDMYCPYTCLSAVAATTAAVTPNKHQTCCPAPAISSTCCAHSATRSTKQHQPSQQPKALLWSCTSKMPCGMSSQGNLFQYTTPQMALTLYTSVWELPHHY